MSKDINHIHKTLDDLFTCDDCNHLFSCQDCGGSLEEDMLAVFMTDRICIKCINKKHKKALKR